MASLETEGNKAEDKLDDREQPGSGSGLPRFLLDHADIDRGWAWLALFSSFSIMMLGGLCMPMIGIMYVHQLETFGKSPALTACIGSLMSSLISICGPVSGWVSKRFSRRLCSIVGGLIVCVSLAVSSQSYNFWIVFVTNGILAGFGLGLLTATSLVNVGCYFVKRRSTASAICVIGFPIGVFLCTPILQYLESVYGWRGALLIFAGVQLNNCIMGVIMQPSPMEKYKELMKTDISLNEDEIARQSDDNIVSPVKQTSVFRNVPFYFLSLACLFSNCSINCVYVLLPRFVLTKGGAAGDIQMLYLVLGLSGVISKFLVGLATGSVKNAESIDKIVLLLGSHSILGTAILVFTLLSDLQSYRLFCTFIVGFFYNVEPVLYVPIIMETVQFSNLADAVGIILFFVGIGFLIGPPLAALVASETGEYDNAFYLAGAINFLSVFCIMAMVTLRSTRAERVNQTPSTTDTDTQEHTIGSKLQDS